MRRIFLSSLFRGICRAEGNSGILPDKSSRLPPAVCTEQPGWLLDGTGKMPVSRGRHALAVYPNFADAFYPREHVVHSLAAEAHQFRADDARHKIAGQIQNLLRCRTVEPLAKNSRHRASERLHLRTERHANVCLALLIYVQINAD